VFSILRRENSLLRHLRVGFAANAIQKIEGTYAMASYNRVILVGNLTRDPELRYIPSGTAVTDVGIAVNDRVKRGDQWVDEATFVDVTLWGRTAEIANEYLSKGSPVLIEGRLKLDRWEKEGQKHSKLKVVGERLQMLGSKGGGGGGGGRSSGGESGGSYDEAEQYSPAGGPPPSEDIPF
jgi:single-strand DNA-binding protein